jgi:hypothetical protein
LQHFFQISNSFKFKIGLGTNKPIARINTASQLSQLPSKKYQNTGRTGHKPMMLPIPDPFWGRQHVKVKKQESKSQGKPEII